MKIDFVKILILCLFATCFYSCNDSVNQVKEEHFISDTAYLSKVISQFDLQKSLAQNRYEKLFKVFDSGLTLKEAEALQFLYAYMPLSDLADYSGDFFLQIVRTSFSAQEHFGWNVPEEIFRHFVLPYRVNNENLDTSRVAFYEELKERLKSMDMMQATLEVNHWCHEKANYQPSDSRTSCPLATVKTAYGRCGEESTFTVSALRSVGIPARQCYTPFWAHCDDNHAWVEVWVDGQWYFLGACEPEPELNMGWFAGPSKRAMLVNTNVFGDYNGHEEIINKGKRHTKINQLPLYAPTKELVVKVSDAKNNPLDSAQVEFRLYNYAEFRPIASKKTDSNGIASLITGYGDLMVFTSYKDAYDYQFVTVEQTDTVMLTPEAGPDDGFKADIDIIPPVERILSQNSAAGSEENKKRFAYEDSVRNAYISTFISESEAYKFAREVGLDSQKEVIWDYLNKSRGNWQNIKEVIKLYKSSVNKLILPLLSSISEKDLRDAETQVLTDHLISSLEYYNEEFTEMELEVFTSYVLSPRIDLEKLTDYKGFLLQHFDTEFIKAAQIDPYTIIKWIADSIDINEEANYYNVTLSPRGVYELRVADKKSINVFFVAICRSFGIPARLAAATGKPEYYNNNEWVEVSFEKEVHHKPVKGYIKLSNISRDIDFEPLYYKHFSISHKSEGSFYSLDYGWDTKFSDLPEQLEVDTGVYMLVTGNRLSGGSVNSNIHFFKVAEGETKNIEMAIRPAKANNQPLGKVDVSTNISLLTAEESTPIELLCADGGMVLAWLEPGKEPTNHFMKDVLTLKNEFENADIRFAFILDEQFVDGFKSSMYDKLPANSGFYEASSDILLSTMPISITGDYPYIAYISNKGDIFYFSHGYSIGIGEQILKTAQSIK